MAKFASLPLFTDAFISDTAHLNAQQTGAYIMLLMCAWRTPDCRLPDDDKILSRFARMDMRSWKANKSIIMGFWRQDENTDWYQRRLLDERNYVEEKRNKNVAAGKISALKNKERHSTDVITERQHKDNEPTPTLSTVSKDTADSIKSALWKQSVLYLGESKRGMVGKLVKEYGESAVLDAVMQAQQKQVVDPVAYINKILKPVPWNMKPQNRMPSVAGG